MKPDKNELDVDFIGGQGALTKDEETAISQFIKGEKVRRGKPQTKIAVSQGQLASKLHR